MKVETQENADFTEYLDATAWIPGISSGWMNGFAARNSKAKLPPG